MIGWQRRSVCGRPSRGTGGFLHGGMAAAPEGDGTRVAFVGALRLPGMRLADPILRRLPLGGGVLRRLEARLQART